MKHPDYRFCPACGGTLEARRLKAAEPDRLVCTACGFIFYMQFRQQQGSADSCDNRSSGVQEARMHTEIVAYLNPFPGLLFIS